MTVGAVILVEPSLAGNLGAAMRVAANFAVPRLHLVNPGVAWDDDEVRRWACGAADRLEIESHRSLQAAAAEYRTLIATASGRGRESQPVISPDEAAAAIAERGPEHSALVFGNETSGLSRDALDRCDLVVRVPTAPGFPVLNLTQTIAILLAYLSMDAAPTRGSSSPPPANHELVEGLMDHLREALLAIGFLDPANPDRVLRQLRRLLGRAGASDHEVAMLRGVCRQMLWAARTGPLAGKNDGSKAQELSASSRRTFKRLDV